jgi:long-chain acyl-CoA synthetase
MKKAPFQHLFEMERNGRSKIVYFRNGRRWVRSYSECFADIDACAGRLKQLPFRGPTRRIGLLAPISYEWLVADLACLLGGFQSVALPEGGSVETLQEMVRQIRPEYILVDESTAELGSKLEAPILSMRGSAPGVTRLEEMNAATSGNLRPGEAQECWSISFTSGTTGKITPLELRLPSASQISRGKRPPLTITSMVRSNIRKLPGVRNKYLVFMPFSHAQQRAYVRVALGAHADIVLSDAMHCLQHIRSERPNILVSAPLIYEIMAGWIEEELRSLQGFFSAAFRLYSMLGLNQCSRFNPLRAMFDWTVLRRVRAIYGGRADYFVTGNAPIKQHALRTFYKVGVKIFESYGQSEVGAISISSSRKFKLGSVGVPLVNLKISEDSEILVQFKPEKHDSRIVNLTEDGYVQTGDLGYLDPEGFLFVTGRKDDLIVCGNGKKVMPNDVERHFLREKGVLEAVLLQTSEERLGVILVIDPSAIADDEHVAALIGSVNARLAMHERVECFLISKERLGVDSRFFSGMLKLKRKAIAEEYRNRSFISLANWKTARTATGAAS